MVRGARTKINSRGDMRELSSGVRDLSQIKNTNYWALRLWTSCKARAGNGGLRLWIFSGARAANWALQLCIFSMGRARNRALWIWILAREVKINSWVVRERKNNGARRELMSPPEFQDIKSPRF